MRYALETHAALIEELRVVRAQAREEKLKKEAMLDDLIKSVFGDEAAAPLVLTTGTTQQQPYVQQSHNQHYQTHPPQSVQAQYPHPP